MNNPTPFPELRGWIDELTEIRATLQMLAERIENSTDADVATHLCRRLANVEEYLDFLLAYDLSHFATSGQSVTYVNVLEADVDRLRDELGKLSSQQELAYERGPITDDEQELLDGLKTQYEQAFAAPSSIAFKSEEVDR